MMHELVTISHEWKSCQSMEILSAVHHIWQDCEGLQAKREEIGDRAPVYNSPLVNSIAKIFCNTSQSLVMDFCRGSRELGKKSDGIANICKGSDIGIQKFSKYRV